MPSPGPLAQVFLCSLLLMSFAQQPPQDTTEVSRVRRFQLKQEHQCRLLVNAVDPIYPRESRLAHTEGVVKLVIVIAKNGSVADVQSVSGDPLLLDSVITAVRQWRSQEVYVNGQVVEAEVPLTFTFTIQDPPKPAYLHSHQRQGHACRRATRIHRYNGIHCRPPYASRIPALGNQNHSLPSQLHLRRWAFLQYRRDTLVAR